MVGRAQALQIPGAYQVLERVIRFAGDLGLGDALGEGDGDGGGDERGAAGGADAERSVAKLAARGETAVGGGGGGYHTVASSAEYQLKLHCGCS
jgi:hypothetical protein